MLNVVHALSLPISTPLTQLLKPSCVSAYPKQLLAQIDSDYQGARNEVPTGQSKKFPPLEVCTDAVQKDKQSL